MFSAAPSAPQADIAQYWEEALRGLEREVRKWTRRLADGSDPLRPGEQARLRALIATLRLMGSDAMSAQIQAGVMDRVAFTIQRSIQRLTLAIPEWAVASADEAAVMLGWANVPNPNAVTAAATGQIGQLTADFQRLTASAQAWLQQNLVVAVAAGESPRTLAKRISGIVDVAGRKGQARSVMIARTTLARTYDVASQVTYRAADREGLIKGWRWQARQHPKAGSPCEVCATLNGMVFPTLMDTYRHPNCVCVMIPVLQDQAGTVWERNDVFPDTEQNVDRLELVTRPSGWTNWQLKPEKVLVPHPTIPLRDLPKRFPAAPAA